MSRPIGVFDSGVGGLTVFKALERALDGRPLIYLGDTARVPYGTRSNETVVRYALEAARFLSRHGVEMMVVACNTASSVAIDELREITNVPVHGVIGPGARRAAELSRTGRIGVIGTRATVESGAYSHAIRELRADAQVISRACPLFVPLAEEGWTENEVVRRVAETYLADLERADVDTLVLGCTHYPLLRGVIGSVMGDGVRVVDSAESVAAEIRGRLPGKGSESKGGDAGSEARDRDEPKDAGKSTPGAHHRFFVTDAPGPFRAVAERFLGRPIPQLERARIDGE